MPDVDVGARVWPNVEFTGFCWLWTKSVTVQGYGQTGGSVNGVRWFRLVHRWVWQELVGPVTDETLDHLCFVPRCCNPDHLEPISREENSRRALVRRYLYIDRSVCAAKKHPASRVRWYRESRYCLDCRAEKYALKHAG